MFLGLIRRFCSRRPAGVLTPHCGNNKNAFREYSYLIGGQGGYIDPFQKFQLKIVFNSLNNAKVPVIKDLRCIALAD